MGILRGVKNGVKSAFNAKKWVSADQLKSNAGFIASLVKKNLNNKPDEQAVVAESFDDYLKKSGLTEKQYQERRRYYRNISLIYAGVSGLVLIYTIALLFHHSYAAVFECFMLFILMSVLGFKAYITYTLLRNRQLRTTYRSVLNSLKFWS